MCACVQAEIRLENGLPLLQEAYILSLDVCDRAPETSLPFLSPARVASLRLLMNTGSQENSNLTDPTAPVVGGIISFSGSETVCRDVSESSLDVFFFAKDLNLKYTCMSLKTLEDVASLCSSPSCNESSPSLCQQT